MKNDNEELLNLEKFTILILKYKFDIINKHIKKEEIYK
mgnify:CR=1 FL=1